MYYGIVSDTNRFLFNTTAETFRIVEELVKSFNIDIEGLYKHLYARPFSEVRFQGYISENTVRMNWSDRSRIVGNKKEKENG